MLHSPCQMIKFGTENYFIAKSTILNSNYNKKQTIEEEEVKT